MPALGFIPHEFTRMLRWSSEALSHISSRSLTSLAEEHLHDLRVSQGGKVTRDLLVAGDLAEDPPHDLPLKDNRRRKRRQVLPRRGSARWREKPPGLLPERVFGSAGAF